MILLLWVKLDISRILNHIYHIFIWINNNCIIGMYFWSSSWPLLTHTYFSFFILCHCLPGPTLVPRLFYSFSCVVLVDCWSHTLDKLLFCPSRLLFKVRLGASLGCRVGQSVFKTKFSRAYSLTVVLIFFYKENT